MPAAFKKAATETHQIYLSPSSGATPPLELARRELIHWLSAACPKASFKRTRATEKAAFILGTFEEISDLLEEKLENDRWNDEIIVRSHNGRVILAGSNPRSVLYAVYTYLESLGFTWIVPGKDGERVPRLQRIPLDGFDIRHRASLMYRGFGLAGAYDVEMGEEFVEWMARNRFNHLFIEGNSGITFYQQALNRQISMAEARRYDRRIIRAARERGLTFESRGHGWTAWTLGFPPDAPRPKEYVLSEEYRPLAAQLNGKREIYMNSPGNTHLCFSNPRARQRLTELVCGFAASHPEIDVLAVWSADGFNNWCECPKCAKVHPADLWAKFVNELAPEVYKVRPELKIEVLGYTTLMEPPPTKRIQNVDGNVIYLYAPFLRCYLHTLDAPDCVSDTPLQRFPPVNRLRYPSNCEYFEFFEGWRRRFQGTNYVFDYYCWLPIKRDIFEGNVPETICRDLNSYPQHGINGCIDCSRAQSFWPTPLARWIQARASWDVAVDYEAERRKLLEFAYGEHSKIVDRYLNLTYSCLLPEEHGREEERGFSPEKVRRYRSALPAMRRALEEAAKSSRGARRKLLQRVVVHADFTRLHVDCLLAEAAGRYDKAMGLAEQMHAFATKNAKILAGAADPPEFNWLKRDTQKRLQAKKDGTYVRIA